MPQSKNRKEPHEPTRPLNRSTDREQWYRVTIAYTDGQGDLQSVAQAAGVEGYLAGFMRLADASGGGSIAIESLPGFPGNLHGSFAVSPAQAVPM